MSNQNPNAKKTAPAAPVARHGLRLVKSAPVDHDIPEWLTDAQKKSHEQKKAAKNNPLVRQLSSLADAIDAEIALLMKI